MDTCMMNGVCFLVMRRMKDPISEEIPLLVFHQIFVLIGLLPDELIVVPFLIVPTRCFDVETLIPYTVNIILNAF